MHMMMWLMSDRVLPRSYRTMQGFGVHTFRFVGADRKGTLVKFHWRPKRGTHSLVWDETQKIAGADPDSIAATCGRRSRMATVRSGSWVCS
jgi:catalase